MSTPSPSADLSRLWQEAEELLRAQRYQDAVLRYRQLLGHRQLAPLAFLRLSQLASTRGRQREAVAAALAAFEVRLPEPEILRGIAHRLRELGELRAMHACADDLSVQRGSNPPAMFELARTLAVAGLHGRGLELLERARNAGLRGPGLAYWMGACLKELGHPQAAALEFQAALVEDPSQALALLALSGLPVSVSLDRDRLLAQLREAIASRADSDPRLQMLLYALFAMLDRAGDPEAAWPALERGMQLRRQLFPHDPAAMQALFEHLGTLRPQAAAGSGRVEQGSRPVFVVGMPGAGVELLAQRLGTHPDVRDAGPLSDFIQQLRWCCDLAGPATLDLALAQRAEDIDFAELGQRYLAHVQWRDQGKTVFLDRSAANVACIPYIVRALPQARILHVVGAPMDTCFANLAQWSFDVDPWRQDQVEMADHYRGYRTLMAQMRAQYPDRILDVRRDELVAGPGAVLREVLEFCELPSFDGLDAPVSVDDMQSWRRYEAQLAPLKQRLGALAY
jgi:tetratricopeptide (TPR) repeat protein